MKDHVALIDLDGTVADYDKAMNEAMLALASPGEPSYAGQWDDVPPHIEARRKLIKNTPGFWQNLEKIPLGFEIVEELRLLEFSLHVLTKGPKKSFSAGSEKMIWCAEHLSDAAVTISMDKSLVYGKVLVDDYEPYFSAWLEVRPRGQVVCVAHPWNAHVTDPRVFRYDGTNREALRAVLRKAYDRKGGQEV